MYNFTGSKSLLIRTSALMASALILLACTAPAAPAAAPAATQAVEATATTEPTATAEPAATTETSTVTETTASTETTTVSPSTSVTETTGVSQTTEVSQTSTESQSGPVVTLVDDANYGKILVDSKGMTLYVFDKDVPNKSNCNGGCLTSWPALTVADENATLTAGEGFTGTLAVITRDDGTYQVTANGSPLYTYAKDKQPGDVVGQAVGDVWWVVGSDGVKITTAPK